MNLEVLGVETMVQPTMRVVDVVLVHLTQHGSSLGITNQVLPFTTNMTPTVTRGGTMISSVWLIN